MTRGWNLAINLATKRVVFDYFFSLGYNGNRKGQLLKQLPHAEPFKTVAYLIVKNNLNSPKFRRLFFIAQLYDNNNQANEW